MLAEVTFDPSLGRASYVVRRSGESVSVRRFKAHTLAAEDHEARSSAEGAPSSSSVNRYGQSIGRRPAVSPVSNQA